MYVMTCIKGYKSLVSANIVNLKRLKTPCPDDAIRHIEASFHTHRHTHTCTHTHTLSLCLPLSLSLSLSLSHTHTHTQHALTPACAVAVWSVKAGCLELLTPAASDPVCACKFLSKHPDS